MTSESNRYNVHYLKEFLRKANTPHYPMQGYWIKLGTFNNFDFSSPSSMESLANNFVSDLTTRAYPTNTFIYKDDDGHWTSRFSFKIDNNNNSYNCIYLIALDRVKYKDITELTNVSQRWTLFTQLAAIIDARQQDGSSKHLDLNLVNIIELGYHPKCSFICNSENEQDQVGHYHKNDLGQMILDVNNPKYDKDSFIAFGSGRNLIKETASYNLPEQLLGDMTIRKSGLIQL